MQTLYFYIFFNIDFLIFFIPDALLGNEKLLVNYYNSCLSKFELVDYF